MSLEMVIGDMRDGALAGRLHHLKHENAVDTIDVAAANVN